MTNLSLLRSTSCRVGASVLDAAEDLEVVAEIELDVVVELVTGPAEAVAGLLFDCHFTGPPTFSRKGRWGT